VRVPLVVYQNHRLTQSIGDHLHDTGACGCILDGQLRNTRLAGQRVAVAGTSLVAANKALARFPGAGGCEPLPRLLVACVLWRPPRRKAPHSGTAFVHTPDSCLGVLYPFRGMPTATVLSAMLTTGRRPAHPRHWWDPTPPRHRSPAPSHRPSLIFHPCPLQSLAPTTPSAAPYDCLCIFRGLHHAV